MNIVHTLVSEFSDFEIGDSRPIAQLFSHSASPESTVYPWRGSRGWCARIASALFGDGGARQGWRRNGMERNSEVKVKLQPHRVREYVCVLMLHWNHLFHN